MAKKSKALDQMKKVADNGRLLDAYRASNRMQRNNPKEIREDPGTGPKSSKAKKGKSSGW
jgi:hypothetical protein